MNSGRGLEDLMNHLFASAEALADPKTKKKDLKEEIQRARTLIPTAKTIIECASLSLDAAKFAAEHTHGNNSPELPRIFTGEAKRKALPGRTHDLRAGD